MNFDVSNNMNESIHSIDQLLTSFSIETLQEIVRNCQRNEQRLHELERHIRYERKKAECLLREKECNISLNENSKPKQQQQQSIEFFISFDDDNHHRQDKHSFKRLDSRITIKEQQNKSIPSIIHSTSSNEQKKSTNIDDELTELTHRCENLLSRINTHRNQVTILENSQNNQSITLQQSLELLRPEFISHSRQRVQHINHLREKREHNAEINHQRQQILSSSHSKSIKHHNIQTNPVRLQLTYQQMKQISKKKYQQLPEFNDRLRQGLISEIRRRNYLRAKLFRIRLRQHVLLHGRTNIDASLIMIDT